MPSLPMQRFRDISHNALRIVTGFAFMSHGGQKLFGWFGAQQAAAPLFPLGEFITKFFPVGMAGILEFFGGAMLVLGLYGSQVAFIVSGEMAVTYFWRHFGFGERSIWWWSNRGELPLLYCFIWLFIWAHGSGAWSLDALLKKRKAAGR